MDTKGKTVCQLYFPALSFVSLVSFVVNIMWIHGFVDSPQQTSYNSASHAFCNQPAVGGPVYWIGNIAYHLPGGSSRLTGGSAGVLFYHNTILSETAAQKRRPSVSLFLCVIPFSPSSPFATGVRTR